MNQILIALAAGAVAGFLDCIPMIMKKLDPMFILSAFFMWLVSGIFIHKAAIFSSPWQNGICVAGMVFLPLLFLIVRMDKAALPQIIAATVFLGALIGLAEGLLLG